MTTGASNDIQRATDIARKMVTQWGLSSLGPLTFGEEQSEVFLGKGTNPSKDFSDNTAEKIDHEVQAIVDRAYQRALSTLETHLEHLHRMADALMKYETIDAKQIDAIMAGQEPEAPEGWSAVEKA